MQKTGRMKQRLIQMDLKALDAFSLERIEKGQEKQLCLHQCSSRLGMDLKLILHWTITILGKRSLVIWSSFKRLFLMCWQFTTSLLHLYIKEYRLRVIKDSNNNLHAPKLCWSCSTSKFHLEFLIKVQILEILES